MRRRRSTFVLTASLLAAMALPGAVHAVEDCAQGAGAGWSPAKPLELNDVRLIGQEVAGVWHCVKTVRPASKNHLETIVVGPVFDF